MRESLNKVQVKLAKEKHDIMFPGAAKSPNYKDIKQIAKLKQFQQKQLEHLYKEFQEQRTSAVFTKDQKVAFMQQVLKVQFGDSLLV